MDLKALITETPDFPKPGILFRDMTPVLRTHFTDVIDAIEKLFSEEEWKGIDAVAGIESRGFILAAAIAQKRGIGFVPIRKQGKLPPPVVRQAYALEYGEAVLEMQKGSGRILIIDDVLATGGTLKSAADVAKEAGYEPVGTAVFMDLKLIPSFTWNGIDARSVISYE
jgi:adenine phosphoribosyltransferase